MSLCFAYQRIRAWPQARPQRLLPADSSGTRMSPHPPPTLTYTHTHDRKSSAKCQSKGSECNREMRSAVRVKAKAATRRQRRKSSSREFRRGEPALCGGIMSGGTRHDSVSLSPTGSGDGRGMWDTVFPAQDPGRKPPLHFLEAVAA